MTSIGPLSLTSTADFAPAALQTNQGSAAAASASAAALTARDDAMAELPQTSAYVNQLQSLSSSASATPAPQLPTAQQQTQAQQSAAQPALHGDYYADTGDAG